MTNQVTPILELRGVNKSFGMVHVLRDVDFAVYPGEVTALVGGDNGGAGKSTLVKAIAGIHPIDGGEYLFEGERVTVHGPPNDVAALGVEVVYQDLALCENLDIVSNMFLGREIRRRGVLDEAKMETMAREALASLSVRTVKSVRQTVSSLSGGSGRPSRSPSACCGTPRSSCSTSRRPHWAWRRRGRSSTWCDAWPTKAWASS